MALTHISISYIWLHIFILYFLLNMVFLDQVFDPQM